MQLCKLSPRVCRDARNSFAVDKDIITVLSPFHRIYTIEDYGEHYVSIEATSYICLPMVYVNWKPLDKVV